MYSCARAHSCLENTGGRACDCALLFSKVLSMGPVAARGTCGQTCGDCVGLVALLCQAEAWAWVPSRATVLVTLSLTSHTCFSKKGQDLAFPRGPSYTP